MDMLVYKPGCSPSNTADGTTNNATHSERKEIPMRYEKKIERQNAIALKRLNRELAYALNELNAIVMPPRDEAERTAYSLGVLDQHRAFRKAMKALEEC